MADAPSLPNTQDEDLIMTASIRFNRRRLLAAGALATVRAGWAAESPAFKNSNGDALLLSRFVGREPAADASAALVAALKQASAEQRVLVVDGRFSIGHDLPVVGPVKVVGRQGQGDGFDLLPPPATIGGGIHGHLMLDAGHSIDGVSFEELTFRGGYDAGRYSGSLVFPVIRTSPHAGIVHKNIVVRRCHFIDPVNDCIQASPDMGGRVEALSVLESDADVTVPLDRASRSANLVRTILEYPTWSGQKDSYGKVVVQGVKIQHCRARGIRTLADIKRGTSDFLVSDCKTEDMSDCHHSVDGSFHGVFERVDGIQRSPLIKAKNFIELQGEDIEIRDFSYQGSSLLGAVACVLVTSYALPPEGVDAVHQSRGIRILRGRIVGVAHHAIRLLNVDDAQVRDIVLDDVKLDAVAVENPRGGLTPGHIVIDNVRPARKPERGQLAAGVFIAPAARGVRISNVVGFRSMTTGGGRAE